MKSIIFTAGFLLSMIAASAQLNYGLKAGVNVSTIKSEENYHTKSGLYIGGLAQYSINPEFRLQGELNLSMQGAKWDKNGDDRTSSTYLQLPVLASYRFKPGLFVEAGPQFGFLLSATDHYDSESHNVKEYVKKFDAGLAVGAGYAITPQLSTGLRYNAGLVKWYKDERNAVFQVGLSYLLGNK